MMMTMPMMLLVMAVVVVVSRALCFIEPVICNHHHTNVTTSHHHHKPNQNPLIKTEYQSCSVRVLVYVYVCVARVTPTHSPPPEFMRNIYGGEVTSRKWLLVTGIWRIANCSLALRSISRAIGRQDCTESAQSSRKSNTEAGYSNVSEGGGGA